MRGEMKKKIYPCPDAVRRKIRSFCFILFFIHQVKENKTEKCRGAQGGKKSYANLIAYYGVHFASA